MNIIYFHGTCWTSSMFFLIGVPGSVAIQKGTAITGPASTPDISPGVCMGQDQNGGNLLADSVSDKPVLLLLKKTGQHTERGSTKTMCTIWSSSSLPWKMAKWKKRGTSTNRWCSAMQSGASRWHHGKRHGPHGRPRIKNRHWDAANEHVCNVNTANSVKFDVWKTKIEGLPV